MTALRSFLFFTTETYPAFAGDGRNALLFARTIRAKGLDAQIVCLNPNGLLPRHEVVQGVRISRVNYHYRALMGRVCVRVGLVIRATRLSRARQIWLIYGGMPGHGLIILLGKILGRRVIFRSTLYGFDDINTLGGCWLYALVDAYFALNKAFKNVWGERFADRVPVFCSTQGVDCQQRVVASVGEVALLRAKYGLPSDRFIALMQGHLISRKGFPEIFQWLARLDCDVLLLHVGRHSSPNWDLMCAHNHEMAKLEREGEMLLGRNVLFIGETDHVQDFIRLADTFILHSEGEGFSNSLSEAMVAGLPTLVKRIDGIDEHFYDGYNVLLYNSLDEFWAKLELLVNSPSERERIGRNARSVMLRFNDVDDVTDQFLAFVEANFP